MTFQLIRLRWIPLALSLCSSVAWIPTKADAKSVVSLGASTENTTDRYHILTSTLSYWRHQWDPGYPYPDENAEGYNWGLSIERQHANVPDAHFSGHHIVVQAAKKWSPSLVASFGIGHMLFRDSPSRLSLRGQLFYQYYKRDFMRLRYRNGYHYERQLSSGTVRTPLTSQGFVLSSQNYLHDRVRLDTAIEANWVSNGLHRQATNFNLLYGLSPGWPWIWVGIGGEHISHSGRSEDFYSPIRFRSIGSRAEASFPLYGEFSGLAAFNYNVLQEESSPWGTGYYLVGGLKYGLRDQANATLKFNRILSQQEKSSWSSNAMELAIEYPF